MQEEGLIYSGRLIKKFRVMIKILGDSGQRPETISWDMQQLLDNTMEDNNYSGW